MHLPTLLMWMRSRWQQLQTARDSGQSSTELAAMAAALLLGAGLVVLAIRAKLTEKIGIINNG